MKPLASTIVNTGTFTGDSKAMGIDLDNMSHIMSVLTNLYSEPEVAVLREYTTNAIDAHVEAGVSAPIKISLPSTLNPTLMIEDFGVGMTTDELLNLYSSYGSSSKRGTNEQTGMLGLGSKSALAISSQFTVRSRKNGVETTVLVFLNDDGAGEIKVLDTRSTKATGTLIQIPIVAESVSQVQRAASRVFAFIPKHLYTGVDVEGIYSDDFIWIGDNIAYADYGKVESLITVNHRPYSGYYGYRTSASVYAIQGNVAYEIKEESLSNEAKAAFRKLPKGKDWVFIAPIGSLQFTPSREDLYYTNNTNNALIRIMEDFWTTLRSYSVDSVNAAKTKRDALVLAQRWADFGIKDLTWNGQQIPTSVEVRCISAIAQKRIEPKFHNMLPKVEELEAFDYVVTHAGEKSSYQSRGAIAREKGMNGLADYSWYGRGQTNANPSALFFVGDAPANWDWTGIKTIHWKDFGKIKRASGGTNGSGSQAGITYAKREWNVAFSSTKVTISDDGITDNLGRPVVYMTVEDRVAKPYTNSDWYVWRIEEHTIIQVNKNMLDKFKQEFPNIPHIVDFAKSYRQQAIAETTEEIRIHNNYSRYTVMRLNTPAFRKKLLDPVLRSVVESNIKGEQERNLWDRKYQGLVTLCRTIGQGVQEIAIPAPSKPVVDRMNEYGHSVKVGFPDLTEQVETLNAIYYYKHQRSN